MLTFSQCVSDRHRNIVKYAERCLNSLYAMRNVFIEKCDYSSNNINCACHMYRMPHISVS